MILLFQGARILRFQLLIFRGVTIFEEKELEILRCQIDLVFVLALLYQ